jgi:NAD(P)-dependent dehydrogenase (short-subunit alcohol dehydrogenase family)
MRVIALDERAMGVRVNAVAPTQVRTQANVGSMGADAAYVDRESVAAVVRYLLSDDARNVSGQVLRLS